jgi:hypothetical protein
MLTVLHGLAQNPALPPDLVDRLIATGEPDVLHTLAGRSDLTATQRHALGERGVQLPEPGPIDESLARHPHVAMRRELAGDSSTPPHLLEALATEDGIRGIEQCDGYECPGAVDPAKPHRPGVGIGTSTIECCDGTHREAIAGLHYSLTANPTTPAHAVAAFVNHPSRFLRRELAARTDQPQAVYSSLAADPDANVRAALAANPAIGAAIVDLLAADPDVDVRAALATNPAIGAAIADLLAADSDAGVRHCLLVSQIATASVEALDSLARSPDATVRMLVAERVDLPRHLVDLLATDPDAKVLKTLAPNPALTERQLRAMLAAHGARVAGFIAANPACSPQLLEDLPPVRKALRAIATHPNATPTALLRCLDDPKARADAAGHASLPADVIVALLDHPDGLVADAAAANPRLPLSVMAALVAQPA